MKETSIKKFVGNDYFNPDDVQNYLTEMLNDGYRLVSSITTPETNSKYATVLIVMEKEN